MTTLSTHVLDAGHGVPAVGVPVTLHDADGALLASACTDEDGRVSFAAGLEPGEHELRFASGAWFDRDGRDHFHTTIAVAFAGAGQPHLHVALLLGPWSYTTYRGS